MFGGNAKTHFQVLGRGDNSTGYLMSPFGDERWDIDDQEKMKKIRQRTDFTQSSRPETKIPAVRTMNTNQYYSPGVNNRHVYGEPHQPPPLSCDTYLNHSVSDTLARRPQYHQQNAYPTQNANACDQINNQYPQGKVSQQQMHSGYQYQLADARNYNRTCQQPSYQYQSPRSYPQSSKPGIMNGLQDVRSEKKEGYICDSCQTVVGSRYQQDRKWRSSPDVPITITGETHYKPLGPMEATPNPFFPPREKNLYIPLN